MNLISRESVADVLLQLHNLVPYKHFHGVRKTCNLVLVLYVIIVVAEDAYDIKMVLTYEEVHESQDLNVQLRLVLILIVKLVRNYSVVGLTNDGNQEVKKDDTIEELIEEPQSPNHVNHYH